jgi:hypothetical protein
MTDYFTEIALESPALFYKFDEASGTLADSSGNSVDLDSFTNAPTYGVASIIPSQSETFITMTESGSTEFASTSNNPAALTGDVAWTACWWSHNKSTSTDDLHWFTFSDFIITTRTVGDYIQVTTTGAATDLTYGISTYGYLNHPGGVFFALVHDQPNNDFKLYMNGKLLVDSGAYGTPPSSNDQTVKFGGSGGIDSTMQGFAVVASVLSAARILELYHSGVAGQTAAPIP